MCVVWGVGREGVTGVLVCTHVSSELMCVTKHLATQKENGALLPVTRTF